MRQRRFWILAVLLFGSILASCCIGRYPLTLREIWEIVTGTMTEGIKSDIFFRVGLSRVFFVCLSGGALSVAGLVYQNLFQNPLVSPDVLGGQQRSVCRSSNRDFAGYFCGRRAVFCTDRRHRDGDFGPDLGENDGKSKKYQPDFSWDCHGGFGGLWDYGLKIRGGPK